jgi:hypothetical protein
VSSSEAKISKNNATVGTFTTLKTLYGNDGATTYTKEAEKEKDRDKGQIGGHKSN